MSVGLKNKAPKVETATKKHARHSFKPEHFSTPRSLYFRGQGGEAAMIGLGEPEWPSADEQKNWTFDQREKKVSDALSWYNYTQSSKNASEFFFHIFEKYPYRAKMYKALKTANGWYPPTVPGWYCRMATMGLVLTGKEKRFIVRAIRKMLTTANTEISAPETNENAVVKPNIQDHMMAKVKDTFGALEGLYDDFITSNYAKVDVMKVLFEKTPPPTKVKDLIRMAERHLHELNEVVNGRDEQLVEGYKMYGKRGVKQMIEFWNQVITDINNYGLHKKKDRAPRKRKAVSPEKMVAKITYLKASEELKLKSIDPTTIIRSSELWVYNVKTRKLGVYVVSATASAFDVKGKRLTNADPVGSIQKTLRKPKEQLAEFSSLGKPGRRAWFKKIKSTEIKLKNIINKDSILLSASK